MLNPADLLLDSARTFSYTPNMLVEFTENFHRDLKYTPKKTETFEKCSISFKFKEGENFNRRNTLSILRIKI